MLRGLTWVVYGMDAMPKTGTGTHPVRPDFLPDGRAVHTGHLVFSHEGGAGQAYFRLKREMVTKADGPHVEVLSETETLERRTDGDWGSEEGWTDSAAQLPTLRRGYFKPELREIIFADADKAEEFVGGPESSHSDEVMERSVTGALNRLLGMEVMDDAIDRTQSVRATIRKRLDEKSEKTSDLPKLRDRLADMREELETAQSELETQFIRLDEVRESIAKLDLQKEKLFSAKERTRELQAEVAELRLQAKDAHQAAEKYLESIIGRFHEPVLPAVLMGSALRRASRHLGGLREAGVLPPGEVSVIPRVLAEGECICGTDCSEGTEARQVLKELLRESSEYAEGRSILDEARMNLNGLVGRAKALGSSWREGLDRKVVECSSAAAEAQRLDQVIQQKTEQMENLSEGSEEYEELAERAEKLDNDRNSLERNIQQQEMRLGARFAYESGRGMFRLTTEEEHEEYQKSPLAESARENGLLYQIDSLAKTISSRERTEEGAKVEQTQLRAAEDVTTVLKNVLDAVRREQIPEVSGLMNEMYRDVMQAGESSPTSEVGVARTSHGKANREYQVVAKNEAGHRKPIGLLAGSERRAVSTAFLLALVKASQARVPFVSDSLLHAVGGTVRTNLIKRIVTDAAQSIMFAIRADLSNPEDRDLLLASAGKTYTITNQAHYPEKVVNKTDSKSGSRCVLCTCGPGEYCDVCERVGDDAHDDLSRNDASTLVN